ncbi:MAG: helix-turn-helix domain-containing protein [Nitrospinota bacterium]|nr:helix-turn-helix domain-containing protein [Nitrospinota bacterium]
MYRPFREWNNLMTLRKKERTYSRYCRDAAQLLGKLIQLARKERRFSESDLADRAGISRSTLQRIEKGDLTCEMGLVFEVATIVGIKLFEADSRFLTMQIERADDKIALLPKTIRKSDKNLDDDF